MKELKERLKKLESYRGKVDFILLTHKDPNFFYLTNSDVQGTLLYDFEKPVLFTNIMEEKRAKKSWISNISTSTHEITKKIKNKKVGMNFSSITVDEYKIFKTNKINCSSLFTNARMTKTTYEINKIKKACEITGKVWKYIEKNISKSISEVELKSIIEQKMASFKVVSSFPTIVASGKNSKIPHHVPTGKKITLPVVIDFGVKYDGYCSDVTRTIGSLYEKRLNQILEELYNEISYEGYALKDAEKFTREKLGKDSKFFIHSLGHGIGLEVHEKPNLSGKSIDKLNNNMVFTIEPGIYKGQGIRIENDFLFLDKLKNLTLF